MKYKKWLEVCFGIKNKKNLKLFLELIHMINYD